MIKAVVVPNGLTADSGIHSAKATSTTVGQTESSVGVWKEEGLRTGIWEVTPGTFPSTRDGYDEICQVLSGRATITEPDGHSFEITAGSLFVTPAGWKGTWEVHETLRKVWVILDHPTAD